MEAIKQLHNEAMDLAQMAQIANRREDAEKATSLFLQAFDKEKEAAMMAYQSDYPQPGLSILLQSASYLAVTCNLPREAEKLACLALSGDAPSEIRQDLRSLLLKLDLDSSNEYETYTLRIPTKDNSMLNAINLVLERMGCSLKKITPVGKIAVL